MKISLFTGISKYTTKYRAGIALTSGDDLEKYPI